MAGKTFSGIGVDDLDKLIPPVGRDGAADAVPAPSPGAQEGEDGDVRGVYSGPTVVDDDKVAEGLKRLRSLERTTAIGSGPPALAPPDPIGEVSELVADMDSSEPTKIGMPHQRPTAMGHSIGDEPPGREQPVGQIDNLRGTMFGHMVHLPDLHIPIDTDEPSGPASGPTYTPPPKPAATQQLVRYQAPSVPSTHSYPMGPPPPRRSPFPSNEPDLRTETIPPLGKKTYGRVIGALIGTALLGGGGALAYRYYRSDDAAASAQMPVLPAEPVSPRPTGAPPPGAPPPPAAPAPAAAVDPTAPKAAAEPSVAEAPPAAAPAAKPSPASDPPLGDTPPPRHGNAEPSAALAPPPAATGSDLRPRRRGTHADKRHAPTAAPAAADVPEAPKPAPKKKGGLDEDPDATLPPSTAE